ncbi:MAG: host attachment protein [Gemmobacter sp.]
MALLAKGMVVVVADGEKAMVLVNEGSPKAPRLMLRRKVEQEVGRNRELLSDRAGRMPDPGPRQRSAMELPDPAREAREHFAAELASELNGALEGEARIVLAAPPQTLAVLREHLAPALRARVLAELPKSLTHHPTDRIAAIVAADIDGL